jgi:hypothetical protein
MSLIWPVLRFYSWDEIDGGQFSHNFLRIELIFDKKEFFFIKEN